MLCILQEDASNPFNLSELLDELSRKQKEELWQRLRRLLTDVLLESPVEGWQAAETQGADSMETDHGPKTVVWVFRKQNVSLFFVKR